MPDFQLAQINIAQFRLPPEHPVNIDFVSALDEVNAIAENQAGFIWRLVGDGNDALDINAYDDPNMIVNMSVWENMDALAHFVYRTPAHRQIMRRRKEWFEKIDTHMALWWVPAGHKPSPQDGQQKLALLAERGPTAQAFNFKHPFPSPSGQTPAAIMDECA